MPVTRCCCAQIPKHQGKPTADPFCGYFSRWTDVQKATDDAVRDLGKTGGLTCGLDTAVVRFVGASALHALMLNNVYSSKVRSGLNQGSSLLVQIASSKLFGACSAQLQ